MLVIFIINYNMLIMAVNNNFYCYYLNDRLLTKVCKQKYKNSIDFIQHEYPELLNEAIEQSLDLMYVAKDSEDHILFDTEDIQETINKAILIYNLSYDYGKL